LIRRERGGVATDGLDVGVLRDHPEARSGRFRVLVHGVMAAEEREPLVGDALGEDIPVEQVDVIELHGPSLEAGPDRHRDGKVLGEILSTSDRRRRVTYVAGLF
jgi:hypothetical protein